MKQKLNNFFKEVGIYLIVIIVMLFIRCYVAAFVRVNGDSMKDTLHHKDIMILDKISYRFSKINRFDIVVIKENKEYLIKRVIGLPGEVVEYRGNTLYIDGEKVKENFSHKKTEDFNMEDLNVSKVPEDMYLVLGDNRTNSLDSRILGFIPRDHIVGKSSFTLFPFTRIGIKK